MDISEVTKMAMTPGYAALKLAETVFGDVENNKSIKELEEEAIRQNLQQAMLESKAKVLQEIAIANRIENATTVEIEEYYDLGGSAGVGVSTDGQSVGIGLSAEGKRVSKRIYRFTGMVKELSIENTSKEKIDEKLESVNKLK